MNGQTAIAPLESFDDMTPIENDPTPVVQGGSAGSGAAPGLDTFENDNYVTDQAEVDKAIGKGSKDGEGDDVESDDKDTPPNTEFDGDDDKKEVKKETDVDKSEEAEADSEDKPDKSGKSLKLKDGKDSVDINPDATMKVKINGKNEIVSVNELMQNYSGKVAYDKKFNELQDDVYNLTEEKEAFGQERDNVVSHMQKIGQMLNNKEDPLEALLYLVDISGRDVLDYNKQIVSHMQGQVESLMEMDDVEQQLYWRNKELDYIKSNQTAKGEELKTQQTQRDLQAKIQNLRESSGVSEDQYFDATKKLKQLGYNESSPEQVVEYAKMEPHFNRAEGLGSEFQDDLGDNEMDVLVNSLARTIAESPKLSDEDAILIATKKLGWKLDNGDEDIEALNNELDSNSNSFTPDPNNYSKPKGTVESFDDFDDQFYQGQQRY